MESIGDKLTSAREAKKMDLKQVAKDTNISYSYLEALENEAFDKFPSETYIIGFLRSYAEYLKLDADEIIQHYKAYIIGESATPLEELTKPTRMPVWVNISSLYNEHKNIFLISGGMLGLILVAWLFIPIFNSTLNLKEGDSVKTVKEEYQRSRESRGIENIRNLQLTKDSGFVLLYKNEAAQFMVENKEVMLHLTAIGKKNISVEILPGELNETLEMEKPKTIENNEIPRSVICTLKGLTENRAKVMVELGKTKDIKVAKAAEETPPVNTDNTKVVALDKQNLQIVFEAQFKQKTYLELYLDGVQKKRGIVQAGAYERWEAREYIQLKIGNAGGINAKINGKAHNFGLPGQIANKVITWKKSLKDPNVYEIVVKDW